MATNTQPQPVVTSDLQPGDRRLMRDLAIGWLTDVTDAAQAQRLITLGYIVAIEGGYRITNAGRDKIRFAKVE